MTKHKNFKREIFERICKKIKKVEIQGSREIAKKAFYAYKLFPTQNSKKKLISLRPTEPLLYNVLNFFSHLSYPQLLKKFEKNQEKINHFSFKLIKNNSVIFTHCHSSTVINALIHAKKRKKFEVYNTETRPLYQGRRTYLELTKAGIKVTMFIDAAAAIALTKSQGTKKVDLVFLGADAILNKGVVNKVGSGMISRIAYQEKIPVYILADSLKFFPRSLKLEERDFHEVWNSNKQLKIKNPAFELIDKNYITAIVSELGIFSFKEFIKVAEKKFKDIS